MNPDGVARFSVSLNQALLRQLDGMIAEKGYTNRSLAIADIIRDQLVDHYQELADAEAAGTITLVYDHHKAHVQETLTELQHQFRGLIISSLHVHLDHDNCLEVLVVRGRAPAIKALADQLIAAKGVKHGRLSITTTGLDVPV